VAVDGVPRTGGDDLVDAGPSVHEILRRRLRHHAIRVREVADAEHHPRRAAAIGRQIREVAGPVAFGGGDCPPKIKELFLEQVLAFERSRRRCPPGIRQAESETRSPHRSGAVRLLRGHAVDAL
jgi:hypothetical protein